MDIFKFLRHARTLNTYIRWFDQKVIWGKLEVLIWIGIKPLSAKKRVFNFKYLAEQKINSGSILSLQKRNRQWKTYQKVVIAMAK